MCVCVLFSENYGTLIIISIQSYLFFIVINVQNKNTRRQGCFSWWNVFSLIINLSTTNCKNMASCQCFCSLTLPPCNPLLPSLPPPLLPPSPLLLYLSRGPAVTEHSLRRIRQPSLKNNKRSWKKRQEFLCSDVTPFHLESPAAALRPVSTSMSLTSPNPHSPFAGYLHATEKCTFFFL